MKIAELLRTIADAIDTEHAANDQPAIAAVEVIAQPPEEDNELAQLARLAGVARASTTPNEQVFPLSAAMPSGTDMHHSKNPADMRSDSVSLYPKFGAKE